MNTDVKNKKLGIVGLIVLVAGALVLWPITILYLLFILFKYIYINYIMHPRILIEKVLEALESNQIEYQKIIDQYNNGQDLKESEFIKTIKNSDSNLIENLREIKINSRFNRKKLREVYLYLIDYVKIQEKLTKNETDYDDYERNPYLKEMLQIKNNLLKYNN